MVVRENGTTYPNIDSALNKYELIDGKLLGFVINGITFKQERNLNPSIIIM